MRRIKQLVAVLATSAFAGCSSTGSAGFFPPPPRAPAAVKAELRANACPATVDWVLDEVYPYFEGVRAVR